MASLNRVELIGHLGADPESRAMPSGDPVCNLRIATTEKWKDRITHETVSRTEWHRVVVFTGLAKICVKYLGKGDLIHITGGLRTRKWTDKQGVERYSTEIVATEMIMLVTKGGGKGGTAAEQPTGTQVTNSPQSPDDFEDDIPF